MKPHAFNTYYFKGHATKELYGQYLRLKADQLIQQANGLREKADFLRELSYQLENDLIIETEGN